eukprot:TRINITY_DN70190_c0_g1_i1.p2 TRINITY_DN70190_c0_g1~~TRINITY_DN70190_c0_g1_i1.p2  ORF type:complete len:141 (-),score=8.35 TRINITY_DN70190_c0_g1_i1:33-455(-)
MQTFLFLVWGLITSPIFCLDYPAVWNSRRLLQSQKELEMLCNVSSSLKGAYIMFNEVLLESVCGRNQQGCTDIAPVYTDVNRAYPCSLVVEEGLCQDPFMLRGNYCAKSCNRCKTKACKTTLAGCKCLSEWSFGDSKVKI